MEDHLHELEVTTASETSPVRRANHHGVSSRTLRRMNQRLSQDNATPARPLGGKT